MPERSFALDRLAQSMGVATRYTDGLGRQIGVGPDTLVQVCAALGASIETPKDAEAAIRQRTHEHAQELLAPVLVAWSGRFATQMRSGTVVDEAELQLEDGTQMEVEVDGVALRADAPLPLGYHRLAIQVGGRVATATVIAAPEQVWRQPAEEGQWGIAAHLAAAWTRRSRSTGDLADLRTLCDWVGTRGGSLVSLLPLLPTFNDPPAEPSPYSPVSRLFWSELAIDLGQKTTPVPRQGRLLDIEQSAAEVRAALHPVASPSPPPNSELERYAAFRGAQVRFGRNWKTWPAAQRDGVLNPDDVDRDEEQFHRSAQIELVDQLANLRRHLDTTGVGLGLDLAVGVHPEGYDAWSRPSLFAPGMSVGAPPDAGFPSGQGWGFPPMDPQRSRGEGHAYFAASVAHQAALADVLRVDHIMAMQRLYWIPDGMGLSAGTYVNYPLAEMFAVLCLESHRHQCEIVGENLGTVAPAVDAALTRHGIRGMYLAEFEAAGSEKLVGPSPVEVAMIGTHDTPLLAGWLEGVDIGERVELGLLPPSRAADERAQRALARRRLEAAVDAVDAEPAQLLSLVLQMLGESPSPLVLVWLEDLWLEAEPVNIPGSSSTDRPNWRRPMARSLETLADDHAIEGLLRDLVAARRRLSTRG